MYQKEDISIDVDLDLTEPEDDSLERKLKFNHTILSKSAQTIVLKL